MVNTSERFVAFIDIMGFKDLVNRNSHEVVLEKLEFISSCIEHIKNVNKTEEVKQGFDNEEITPYIFSDSITIFTKSNSFSAFILLSYACKFIFKQALSNHIPLKGSIAFGTITVDEEKSIFFGQPIIDAYLLQEEVKYYGLILHHSVENYLSEEDFSNHYKNVKTPTKHGNVTYNNLTYIVGKESQETDKEILRKLYATVSGSPRIYVDNTIDLYDKFK